MSGEERARSGKAPGDQDRGKSGDNRKGKSGGKSEDKSQGKGDGKREGKRNAKAGPPKVDYRKRASGKPPTGKPPTGKPSDEKSPTARAAGKAPVRKVSTRRSAAQRAEGAKSEGNAPAGRAPARKSTESRTGRPAPGRPAPGRPATGRKRAPRQAGGQRAPSNTGEGTSEDRPGSRLRRSSRVAPEGQAPPRKAAGRAATSAHVPKRRNADSRKSDARGGDARGPQVPGAFGKSAGRSQAAQASEEERLQKILARAGFGSRRFCETLITEGRVTVDGQVVRELGVRVNAQRSAVAVDGEPIAVPKRAIYLAVYKLRGVLSDAGSPDDSIPTVLEMAPPDSGHLFPIGRLDLRSEGLVILTSDGEVTHHLTHPSFEHAKVYYVLVEKRPGESELLRLRNGIELEDGFTAPAKVEVVEHLPAELKMDTGPQRGVWLRFELTEGKKRQLRHMTAAVGLPTLRLIRWAIGPLALREMAPGSVRYLTPVEVQKLREYAGLAAGDIGRNPAAKPHRAGQQDGGRRGNRTRRKGPGRGPSTPPGQNRGPRPGARAGARIGGRTGGQSNARTNTRTSSHTGSRTSSRGGSSPRGR